MKKYFETCKTLDELKAEYRKSALANHPDAGGSKEAMQEINAAYGEAFERLKAQQNAAAAADPSGRGNTSMADIRSKYGSQRFSRPGDADGLPA